MRYRSSLMGLALGLCLASGFCLSRVDSAGAIINAGAYNRHSPDPNGAPAPPPPPGSAAQPAPAPPARSRASDSPSGASMVFDLKLSTGARAPRYYQQKEVLIDSLGRWSASSSYLYRTPPTRTSLGRGRLTPARLQALITLASKPATPRGVRFIDLGTDFDDHTVGSSTASLEFVQAGQHHRVQVVGQHPPAFQKLAEAIAQATIGTAKLAPLL